MAIKLKDVLLALVVPAIFLFLVNDAHSDSSKKRRVVTFFAIEKLKVSFPASSIDIVGKFINDNYFKYNDLGLERVSFGLPKRIKNKKGKLTKIVFEIYDTVDNKKNLSYILTLRPAKNILSFKLKMTKSQVQAQRLNDANHDLNILQFRRKINNLLLGILEDIKDYL
jgi:hypothetical protein